MFELRATLTRQQRIGIGVGSVGLLILAWLVLTLGDSPLIPKATLPGPGTLAASVPKMHYDELMIANALVSLLRITLGFVLAALVAVPLGILMGAFTPLRAAIMPIISPLRFLPIAAVVPIFIFWFGLDETMKIALLFLGTFVYLLPLVVETVDQVDDVYLKTAATLGASRWQIIRTIMVPASLPAIFEELRVLYGIGWTYVMLAEFVSVEGTGFGYEGIGFLLNQIRRRGTIADVLVLVAVVLVLGVLVDLLLGWMGRVMFPWAKRDE
ncbi:MAG: ABC transporter permease subunit [Myxococcota bacterium]